MDSPRRILVVGPSRAGKDTACEYLARVTQLRYAGSTSRYLARYVAERLGVPEHEAYQSRHRDRNLWHRVGQEVRKADPGLLVRESLRHADVVAGIRTTEELVVCRTEGLVDLVLWIANVRAGPDSTLGFTERECDVVVPNHWALDEFHGRLLRLARFAGLAPRAP